jgi:hypothetical protein
MAMTDGKELYDTVRCNKEIGGQEKRFWTRKNVPTHISIPGFAMFIKLVSATSRQLPTCYSVEKMGTAKAN